MLHWPLKYAMKVATTGEVELSQVSVLRSARTCCGVKGLGGGGNEVFYKHNKDNCQPKGKEWTDSPNKITGLLWAM